LHGERVGIVYHFDFGFAAEAGYALRSHLVDSHRPNLKLASRTGNSARCDFQKRSFAFGQDCPAKAAQCICLNAELVD
jgi:hypothetical protein